MAGVEGVMHPRATPCTLPTELKIARGIGEGSMMLAVSSPRVAGPLIRRHFASQSVFPAMAAINENEFDLIFVPERGPCHRGGVLLTS